MNPDEEQTASRRKPSVDVDPVDLAQLLDAAVRHHQAGQLADADRLYRRILASDPNHVDSLHLLGVLAHQVGRSDIAVDLIGRAIARNDGIPEFHYNIGLAYGAVGRLDDAVRHLGRAVALRPEQLEAHLNLGNTLRLQGKLDDAAARYEIARALHPQSPEAHYNLGNVLMDLGRFDEAVAANRTALKLRPHFAEAHNNLGTALKSQGKLEEAIDAYRQAVKLKPELTQASVNLGNVMRAQEAEAHYRQALAIDPDSAEAHNNLGSLLMLQGKLDDARGHFERAAIAKPELIEAHLNLARVLIAAGDPAMALNSTRRALDTRETTEARTLFVECVSGLEPNSAALELRGLLVRALSEPWARPQQLSAACARIIKLLPEVAACTARVASGWPKRPTADEILRLPEFVALSADPLVLTLLESTPVIDFEIERLLTAVRFALLDLASKPSDEDAVDRRALRFYCALARQCFINEFVFSPTDSEFEQACRIRDSLVNVLATGGPIPTLRLVAVASYFSLHSLPGALSLLDRAWPDPVSALLTLHVREPESERQIRDSIPRLTAIDDAVSLAVQRQYEENPYPRWLNFAPVVAFASRDDDVAGAILPQGVEQFMKRGITDMLVAGCGTGQQAIEVACAYPGAQVLAIDLSLASLAYAKRMTKANGARNVEYAQADILKLASIGRTFDGIFAAGVLHHLADPFAGWRVLRTLLRSGGIMDIALYSELGRRRIVAGQQFVQDGSYSASAADIRRFRDDVMAQGHGVLFDTMTRIGDFFSVSECRDLLFHVQEQRFTLPEIARFLADNNLRFLGFRLSPSVGRQYRTRFPQDENLTDLTSWQLFEADNPDTFIGMYQFLVQDIG